MAQALAPLRVARAIPLPPTLAPALAPDLLVGMQFRIEEIQEKVRKETPGARFDVADALRALAKPRLCGSEGSAQVRAEMQSRFEALGYEVRAFPFTFSAWAGKYAMTTAGGIYLFGSLGAAILLYARYPGVALVLLTLVLLLTGIVAVMTRPAVDVLPWGRQEGINLFAQKPGARPRYIFMAHSDSKSQPLPLAFRGPAIVFGLLAWIALFVLSLLSLVDFVGGGLVIAAGAAAVIAGVLLVFCWVDNHSPGALDNASGLAALLGIAAREGTADDIAFLVTDAEELGLAGARAIAGSLPAVYGVINMDGLDDEGVLYVIERFGWPRARGLAPHLAAPLLGSASALEIPAQRRDLPFGVLVDHIPIVKAGMPALTLMRGSMASLKRVHRPADSLDRLRGTGVEKTIDVVCGALQLMRSDGNKG